VAGSSERGNKHFVLHKMVETSGVAIKEGIS
jgi:hypothetical protein